MKISITGSFLSHYGTKGDKGLSSDRLREDCYDILIKKDFKAVMRDEITKDLIVTCELDDIKKVTKTMLKSGAYKIDIDYISG